MFQLDSRTLMHIVVVKQVIKLSSKFDTHTYDWMHEFYELANVQFAIYTCLSYMMNLWGCYEVLTENSMLLTGCLYTLNAFLTLFRQLLVFF